MFGLHGLYNLGLIRKRLWVFRSMLGLESHQ